MATYRVIGVGEHRKYFDGQAYRNTTNYILNPQKAQYAGGCGITSLATAAQEMEQTAETYQKNSGKRVRHSVLSFDADEHITPEQADQFAREILQRYGSEYQILYAVHTNTDDVHIHMVMNQISFIDGHRYQGKKQDYYAFLSHMRHVTHLPVIPVK